MLWKISYGYGRNCEQDYPAGTSVGNVLDDPRNRAYLGYGQKVAGHIGSVPMERTLVPREDQFPTGVKLSIHDVATEKAEVS